jgi:hypothetical protein
MHTQFELKMRRKEVIQEIMDDDMDDNIKMDLG